MVTLGGEGVDGRGRVGKDYECVCGLVGWGGKGVGCDMRKLVRGEVVEGGREEGRRG